MPTGTPADIESLELMNEIAATVGLKIIEEPEFTEFHRRAAKHLAAMPANLRKGKVVTHAIVPLTEYKENTGQERFCCGLQGVRISLLRAHPGLFHRSPEWQAKVRGQMTPPGPKPPRKPRTKDQQPPSEPPGPKEIRYFGQPLPGPDLLKIAQLLELIHRRATNAPWAEMDDGLVSVAQGGQTTPVGTPEDYQLILLLRGLVPLLVESLIYCDNAIYKDLSQEQRNQLAESMDLQLGRTMNNFTVCATSPDTGEGGGAGQGLGVLDSPQVPFPSEEP